MKIFAWIGLVAMVSLWGVSQATVGGLFIKEGFIFQRAYLDMGEGPIEADFPLSSGSDSPSIGLASDGFYTISSTYNDIVYEIKCSPAFNTNIDVSTALTSFYASAGSLDTIYQVIPGLSGLVYTINDTTRKTSTPNRNTITSQTVYVRTINYTYIFSATGLVLTTTQAAVNQLFFDSVYVAQSS